MRRILISAAAVAALAVPAAFAHASGGRARLALRHTAVGMILVNARGFTVYAFTRDSRDRDACRAIRRCLNVWPPVTTTGTPLAGSGVRAALIGTITLAAGQKQVTYDGHPLYTYIADRNPGQTTYVNLLQFGGRWPAIGSAGQTVK